MRRRCCAEFLAAAMPGAKCATARLDRRTDYFATPPANQTSGALPGSSVRTMIILVCLPLGGFGDDFFCGVTRHFLVVAEGLVVNTGPAGQGTQRAGVVIKFRRRHAGLDNLECAFGFDARSEERRVGKE